MATIRIRRSYRQYNCRPHRRGFRRLLTEELERRILLTTVAGVDPQTGSHNAPLSTIVRAEFTEAIPAATDQNFVVHASQHGKLVGAATTVATGGNVATHDPTNDFFAGERVQATVRSGLATTGGPHVWQFRTAVAGGLGTFEDSGQALGIAANNTGSFDVKLGDLDGDGDLDALMVNFNAGATSQVFLNSNGTFRDSGQMLGPHNGRQAALGDLDGDGDLDAVIANAGNQPNAVWRNDGNAVFTQTQEFGDQSSRQVSLGDLDGDGDLDAFVANSNQADRVYLNNGGGMFSPSGVAVGDEGLAVNLGDVDGDGDLDAWVAGNNAPHRVLLNDGGGLFTDNGQVFAPRGYSLGVELGDLDGDGDLDAFVARGDFFNRVFVNDGSGSFTASGQNIGDPAANSESFRSWDVELGDVDADGDLDAFVANGFGGDRLYLNDGGGVFSNSGQILPADPASTTFGIAMGDIDGDGDLDVLTAHDANPDNTFSVGRVWLNQNPSTSVTLSVDNATIGEAAGVATFTATLSAAAAQAVTVDLSVSGTATLADDYLISNTQIVIAAGATTGSVTVTAVQDTLDETDEMVIVGITSVTNAQGSGQATTTIVDDDEPPMVSLAVDNDVISESAGVATFTATLSAATGQTVTVDLEFTGAATLTSDYTVSGTRIVIPAGATFGSVTATAVQDTVDEPDETVIVDIGTVGNATEDGTQQQATTITDDDEPPTASLTVDNATILETSGVATFTVALSAPSLLPVTVELNVTGTATPTADYILSDSQIVIAPGDMSGSITVTSVADVEVTEGAETIVVDIAAVTNASEDGTQRATTTIIDDVDGPAVTLSVDQDTIAEAGGIATITATLGLAFSLPVTVDLALSGTAAGDDYEASITQLVIEPGDTTGTVTITGVDDDLIEGDETVVVDIATVINGKEPVEQQAAITIVDDETPPTVTLSLDNASIAEDGVATFIANLSSVSTLPVTVDLGVTGTATVVEDFALSDTQIVVQPGDTVGSITVSAVQDEVDEPDESVIVDIVAVTNGTELDTQQLTVTIIDDDVPPPIPTVSISVDSGTIAEADGIATVTVSLSQISEEPVTVDLTVTGTATAPSDYTISATQVVVAPGDTSGTVVINAVQDFKPEGDETVIVDIASVTNGEVGAQQVTVTIEDDDPQPTVSLLLFNATIPENRGTTQLTAFLSGQSGVPVTIDLEYAGTATLGEDFDAPTQIVIPAGGLNATIAIQAIQDAIDEEDETIIASVASVDGATGGGSQTITIIDDDVTPSVTLSIDQASFVESIGQATVTVFLSTTTGVPVTVDLDYSTGTATLEDDFTASTQLVIPAGGLNASGIIRSVQDSLDEADETVIVEIAAVSNATEAGEQQATTTIEDDDPTPTVSLSIDTDTISEADGAAVLTATLSEVSGQDVTLSLELTGTATLGDDYTAEMALVVPAGAMTGTATVRAVQDLLDEPDETVLINVSAIANAEPTGPQQLAVTIIDDDEPLGLVVTSLEPTSTGFVAHFSDELDISALNLDDAESTELGAADILFVGQASGPVAGSVVVDPAGQMISFIKTGGPLAADSYTVRLRSGADAFKTPAGLLLDGDANGVEGDDLEQTFTVDVPATNAVTLTVPDFVRGPSQEVNLPADTSQGIPVSISEGAGAQTVTLQIAYDPTLLEISGATLAESMPAGAAVTFDGSTTGNAIVAIDSPTSLPDGPSTLFYLQARVPAAASSIYGRQQILDIHSVMVTDGGETPMPSIDDDALHLASYFADVSGNGRINASDAAQVARITALLDSGFAATPRTDPGIVGDISGNGRVNAADASLVARSAALIEVPQIPPIPGGVVVAGQTTTDLGPGLRGVLTVAMQQQLDPVAITTGHPSNSPHTGEPATAGDARYPAVDIALTQLDDSGALGGEEKLHIALEAAVEELFSGSAVSQLPFLL